MWAFFIISIILVFGAILLLLRRFCANSVSLTVKVVTSYGWLVAMAVVAISPIDVYSTSQNKELPALGYMWSVAFWSTQVLTWLLLPFFQYYSDSGAFTIKGKCMYSLKENAILYGSVGAVGLLGLAALLITHKLQPDQLLGLGIGLSNAFGLFASIILLGYGLVEIPRHLWKADPERQLKWCAHRAGKCAENVMKSTAELESVVTIIAANDRQMRRHDPMRKYMDIILQHLEKESPIRPSDLTTRASANGARGFDLEAVENADDLDYGMDVSGLAALRMRMFFAISTYKADRAQYDEVLQEAFEMEDIVKCRQLNDFTPRVPTNSPFKKAWWYYKCALRAHWHRALAVIFGILSLLIVWAESTIMAPVDISPLSLAIQSAQKNEFFAQLVTLMPLAYICACTYTALFSITAFDYNKLVPRATIGSSLMQNGSLMCRFAAPTCWNFYHMIRMTNLANGQKTVFETQFGDFGQMPEILSTHLNTYLPLILVVMCGITALNLWGKLTGCCTSSKFKFSSEDDVDDEYTEKGRQLVAREREAVAKGFAPGQVLTSAFFDLDFPDIVGGPRSRIHQQKKGIFGFFSRNKAPPPAPPPARAPEAGAAAAGPGPGPTRFKSATAAAAAARWLGRGTGVPEEPGPSAAAAGPLDLTSNKASLLASRYDKSPTAEYEVGAAAMAGPKGLDGIFAEVGGGGAAGRGVAGPAATAGGARGGPAGGRGPYDPAVATSEKDSLLSGFWKS